MGADVSAAQDANCPRPRECQAAYGQAQPAYLGGTGHVDSASVARPGTVTRSNSRRRHDPMPP